MQTSNRHQRRAHLYRVAVPQYGLFNYSQALACGFDSCALARALRAGWLERIHPTVYGIAGTPGSWEREVMAACLWGGDTAAASHRSAAALWSLRGFSPAAVEISSCLNRRSSHLPFTAHRVDRFLLEEVGSEIKGIPVTSVRRTLLDVAGAKDPRTEPALDHALLHQLTSLGQMWLLYDQEWTRGRRGIAILRSLLIERTGNRAPTQSELEDRMWRLIQTRALPTPIAQFPIRLPDRVIHVDFCYPDERLVIELDGYAWHGDRRAFEEDRARDNALQALGWRVVRITWAKLRFDPDGVEALLRTYLNLAPVPSAY